MVDIQQILEFSRQHCIAICAFLVPANLLLTLATLIMIINDRPHPQILRMGAIATLPALIMFAHVWSWFYVGVVMAPTFILLGLGGVCLSVNGIAIASPLSLKEFLRKLYLPLHLLLAGY